MLQQKEKEADFQSRSYQDMILQKCIEKNTIVYLPTGSGKTHIALQAIKHFAADLQRPIYEGGKRSIFLTNTVVLAKQQAKCMSKFTALQISVYTGDMDVDNWRKEKWLQEFNDHQVIFATCQIILDVIRHGYLKLDNINVMVFDECHHGQNEHPMAILMAKFNDCPESEQPRVIGLTGSLTKSSVKPINVVEDLYSLESTFRATITTAQGAKAFNEVLMYSTSPREDIITYNPTTFGQSSTSQIIIEKVRKLIFAVDKWPFEINRAIDYTLNKKPTARTGLVSSLKDLIYHFENYGMYGGMLTLLAVIVDFELKKRETDTQTTKSLTRKLITELEELYHIVSVQVCDEDEAESMEVDSGFIEPDEFDEENMREDPQTILSNSTNQIQNILIFLKDHLKNTQPDKQKLKSLVFVQRRISAKILCNIIRRFANGQPDMNLKVDFMVGNNSRMPESIESHLQNRNNSKVLDKFRRGEIDMIVTTNVLEEGIDVQDCNLIIAFDKPLHYRAYVQMKGRARLKTSSFIIMNPSAETVKLQNKIIEWKKINDILRKYLVERSIDRPLPLKEDIQRIVEDRVNETYKTSIGAQLDYFSAISLVNRYIQTLPTDYFTKPTILWRKNFEPKATEKFTVVLEMPPQSTIRQEIHGIVTDSVIVGKRSAAFEACKLLHQKGCLSNNLLPMDKKRFLDIHMDEYFSVWKNTAFLDDKHATAGTKKNYRLHDITTPAEFIDSMPKVNTKVYLYQINIQPQFTATKTTHAYEERENISVFSQLLQSNRGLAILTAKQLPRISPMKFFFSFGGVDCSLSISPIPLCINDPNQLIALKRFHCILFRDILDIWKNFYVYDLDDSILIVPTKDKHIDWEVVSAFQQWAPLTTKTVAERMTTDYIEDDWRYMVITPWYRADTDVRYVVTRLSSHENPFSAFPNENYNTYADYALDKYPDIEKIANANQFLIQVKPMTRNLNILHSGGGDDGGKRKSKAGQELLIPELCHNFKFPADLWLKAMVVPAFIHRLTYALHAERLRNLINEYVGIRVDNYVPAPLFDDMPKKRRSHEKAIIQNPITYPRPNENEAVELSIKDITPITDNDQFAYEIHEPADIDRDFAKLYPIDIEYYYAAIHKRLNNMHIDSKDMYEAGTPTSYLHNTPALCDVPSDSKFHIKLLNKKLTDSVGRSLEQHELLAAITTAQSADVFHMELYEVLGDAFLKFGISLYLLGKHTSWHEGNLSQMKGQIVGNRNLFYCGKMLGLPGIIKVNNFVPKNDWQPPMLSVDKTLKAIMKDTKVKPDILYQLVLTNGEVESGQVSIEDNGTFIEEMANPSNAIGQEFSSIHFLGMQQVADKVVADTVEAILGTCVLSIGIDRSFKVLEMFGILPKSNENITLMLQKKLMAPRIRTCIKDHEVDELLTNHQVLEQSLAYTFSDRAYLLQALTHPSYPTNRVTGCYQQLEFLGDAVLDFLITAYIYERCPHMDPGQLTDLRSALVNNVTLACLAVRNNFHLYMLSQNIQLSEHIEQFVNFQIARKHEVTEHVELLFEEHDVLCRMAEYVDVPKALGDIFEALIGAIFLDSGNNLLITWKCIYRLMSNELENFMRNVPIQLVRRLYEHPTAHPQYDAPTTSDIGKVLVNLQFTCNGEIRVVHGFGDNKENAKKAASKVALIHLRQS